MTDQAVWMWATSIVGLLAALVGLYYASRLNKLTKGGVVGSSVGYVMFGFVILAINSLFDEMIVFLEPLIPGLHSNVAVARDLLRILAMVFFTFYFYRVHKAFAGYAARRNEDAAA